MKKQNESFAQLLKMELMERYGLREDQVGLSVYVYTEDLDLGQQVLADFDTRNTDNRLQEGLNCDYVKGEHIAQVWVHRKDGVNGLYFYQDDNEGENND